MSTNDSTLDEQALNAITRKLYVSHFLSTWNFRGFEFGAVLFLANIFPGTLLPLSVYALFRAACAIVFAPAIGRYIDNGQRLKVIRASIVWQRSAVVVSCILFWVMLTQKKRLPDWSVYALLGMNILLACVEKLCTIVNTVSLERDWVIVIAHSDESALRQLNSQMRRIDLFCKLVSPLVIALIDGVSVQFAILVTFCINNVSMVVEYALIASVYKAVPALATREGSGDPETQSVQSEPHPSFWGRLSFVDNLKIYVSQRAFLPSLSLSMLYLTVLSFAGQMVTYLLSVGYTSIVVGLVRTFSTVFELSATWLAPKVMGRIGPLRSGMWFLSLQMICLTVAVLVFWTVPVPFWAAAGLVAGIIISRVGLWGFDLSAQIIIQEEVEPQCRGAFSTTEAALQNFSELCAYASTIVFFKPSQFKYPTMMSVAAVYIAGALYAKFLRDRRGHLVHHSRCLKRRHDTQSFYQRVGETAG
jgi:solute carrier family 40 (iron-regulated transporter), member 1